MLVWCEKLKTKQLKQNPRIIWNRLQIDLSNR